MRIGVSRRTRIAIFLILMVGLLAASARAGVKESWYLMRGRANMEIKNYKAAIEAYERAVAINPGNQDAQKNLGLAYEAQGLTGKAIDQFDRYLKRFSDDPEVAFKQARYLEAEKYVYRRDDAIRYYRQGLRKRDDPTQRHRLAKLLAAEKRTLPEAVKEYGILVKQKPKDAGIRKEYRDILLWDPSYRREAIKEYESLVAANPRDFTSRRQLARLLAAEGNESRAEGLYADLVAERPGNGELRLEYAKTLAARPSRFDEASQQFETLLGKQDRYETRMLYANHLASRKAARGPALEQYRTLVQQRPGDTEARLRYANLLGSEKRDAGAAIRQYHIVLKSQPRNGEAHAGLARLYAWTGDRDRAAHHNQLARQYGKRDTGTRRLEKDLMAGHEPRMGSDLTVLSQTGGPFSMGGTLMGLNGRTDPTPYTTFNGSAGIERYWDEKREVSGPYLQAGGQYRLDTDRSWEGSLRALLLENADSPVEFEVRYTTRRDDWILSPGVSKRYLAQSLLALAGSDEFGKPIGRAASFTADAKIQGTRGPWSVLAIPRMGWVESGSATPNFQLEALAEGAFALVDGADTRIEAGYGLQFVHFARNHSGFHPTTEEPLAGGYFSPGFHFAQMPHLRWRRTFGQDAGFNLRGGPSWQITSDTVGMATKWGADFQAAAYGTVMPRWHWSGRVEFLQVAAAFNRFVVGAAVHRLF